MTTKLTWYGHATLGLETGGYKIIVDPFFSGNPAASTSAEAVEADFILISHGHGDHVGDAIVLAQRTGATIISVNEIAVWLADRRPDAVITFGAHGVTHDADHVVVGAATRWAVERLAESGIAPHAVYVVAPVFGPGTRRYDLSPKEGAASHRIDITDVAGRKLAALACHASQSDTVDEIAELRAALDRDGVVYEGYTRVRPTVPAARPTFFSRLV